MALRDHVGRTGQAMTGVTILIEKTTWLKCARCWKHCEDTNQHEWADVCSRCDTVLREMFTTQSGWMRAL